MLLTIVVFIQIKPSDNLNVQQWGIVKLEVIHVKYTTIEMMFTKNNIIVKYEWSEVYKNNSKALHSQTREDSK